MTSKVEGMKMLDRQTDRQPAIDIFKFIAAVLVITIHTDPLVEISESANFVLVHIIARVAVPFFIVCTGYFIGKRIVFESNRISNLKDARLFILKSSWKIFKLYLLCSVIYLILSISDWIATGWFSLWAFVDWGIAFFLSGSFYHLWYLMEVCYALLFLALILPLIRKPFVYLLIAVLWALEVLQYAYVIVLPPAIQNIFSLCDKVQMPFESVVRVLPLLLLGIVIQHQKKKSSAFCIVGFVVSMIMLFLEVYFVKSLGGEKYSYVVFTLPLAYFLFSTIHSLNAAVKCKSSLAFAKISTFVYLAHPAFILLMSWIAELPHYAVFFIVTVVSILTGYLYYRIEKTIKSQKAKQTD